MVAAKVKNKSILFIGLIFGLVDFKRFR
jgi:hypothetical protein